MARKGTAPLILTVLIAATAGASGAARAADCLAGPNAPSPQGKHWYYRIDRASHRKCWYLGDLNRGSARATQTNSARRRAARPPEAEDRDDVPVKPPVPARAAAPDAGVGARVPEAAPIPGFSEAGTVTTAPPAEPARVAALIPTVPVPLGARAVTTERVRNEPAPPKPTEAPKPQAAAPTPAASSAHGALPAALVGLALLLGVIGTSLVLARQRLIKTRRRHGWRTDERALRPARAASEGGRPRRSLREILAQAAPEAEDDQARAVRFFNRIRRGLNESPAPATDHGSAPLAPRADTRRPDIAAVTLQPAIDPLVPEPIAPVADVEQSLRRLLDAWERRAA